MSTQSEPNEKQTCCHLDCGKDADWEIWTEPDVYQISYACREHVGDLLDDEKRHRVYPIGWEA